MQPLIEIAIELRVDYQRLRAAAIRGEVSAQRLHGRWLVDREDARRWQGQLETRPVPAA